MFPPMRQGTLRLRCRYMPTEWLQRSTADLLVVLMPDLPSGESCSFGNPRSAFLLRCGRHVGDVNIYWRAASATVITHARGRSSVRETASDPGSGGQD